MMKILVLLENPVSFFVVMDVLYIYLRIVFVSINTRNDKFY